MASNPASWQAATPTAVSNKYVSYRAECLPTPGGPLRAGVHVEPRPGLKSRLPYTPPPAAAVAAAPAAADPTTPQYPVSPTINTPGSPQKLPPTTPPFTRSWANVVRGEMSWEEVAKRYLIRELLFELM